MKFTKKKINTFLIFKLPIAFIAGVRLKAISKEKAIVRVKYKWINQNPFKSMFWAVQGMASELSTGILVMQSIYASDLKISMLVTNMNATFNKKAKGKIHFECIDGLKIDKAIEEAIRTKVGQTLLLNSVGKNEDGIIVSEFQYEWSLKVKE